MPRKSEYLSEKLLGWVAGVDMPSAPATVYVLQYKTFPTDDAGTGGVEQDWSGYTRVAVSWASIVSGTFSSSMENNADVEWGTTPTDYTVAGWAIADADTGGNLLYLEEASPPEEVYANQAYRIPSEKLEVIEE